MPSGKGGTGAAAAALVLHVCTELMPPVTVKSTSEPVCWLVALLVMLICA
jgi:hypothetical protein